MKSNQTPPGGERYRAGIPALGPRLLAAAQLLRPGCAAADIGCDHGKLAVWLVAHGTARHVVAIDKRPMPLARAKALVKQTGLSGRVECRLGDGLAPLAPGEVQEIIIAGVSGETVVDILSASPLTRDTGLHFVFVPAGRQAVLRRWLCEEGFTIDREVPLCEKGRFYTALSVSYTGVPSRPGEVFYEVGLVPQGEQTAARGYISQRLRDIKKRLSAPLTAPQRQALETLIQEVEACLP